MTVDSDEGLPQSTDYRVWSDAQGTTWRIWIDERGRHPLWIGGNGPVLTGVETGASTPRKFSIAVSARVELATLDDEDLGRLSAAGETLAARISEGARRAGGWA